MEFTSVNVETAVMQFYMANSTFQAQAHQWLVAAQVSPHAWSFVWDLLEPNKAPEVQFFAASTLQAKVSKHWHEVPPTEFPNLRTRLLETITAGCSGHRVVLNRLCIANTFRFLKCILLNFYSPTFRNIFFIFYLAVQSFSPYHSTRFIHLLAGCALNMMPEEWNDPVADLMSALQPSHSSLVPADQLACLLLQILTVLPEEFQTMHLAQGRRGPIRFELQKSCARVIDLVQQWLGSQQASTSLVQQAVTCAHSWIQLGVPLPQMETLSNLLQSVVEREIRGDWQVGEVAIDALTQLGSHPEISKYPTTLMRMLSHWLSLHPLAQQLANEGNPEALIGVYRLLVSIAETHSRLVLHALLPPGIDGSNESSRNTCQQLIRVVLACSATPGYFPVHETVSEMAFSFWYLLQDDMVNVQTDWFKPLSAELVPVYRALTETLLEKTVLPTDPESWSTEDLERCRCYRQDVADTMVYCYTVLEDSMLMLLHERLGQALSTCRAQLTDWRPLEACLHAFFAIAEEVGVEENTHLPRFFALLHEIPAGVHLKVVATALDAVGAYAEWINAHPDMLGQVVPLLVTGLLSSESAPSATMALKDLTRDCQACMRPFADLILHASKEALGRGSLRHNESIRLMYVVGKVLSVLPMPIILQQLELIVMPYIAEIHNLLQEQPSATVKASLLLRLKMLSMLFGTLDTRPCEEEEPDVSEGSSESADPAQVGQFLRGQRDPQPVYLVLERVLPDLANVASSWGHDQRVMDAVYAVLKNAVSTLLDECRPLLGNILNLLVTSFKLNPQPSAFDLAKQFLVMFGSEVEPMQQLLSELVGSTLTLCAASLPQHTDLAEALMLVLAQVLKKAPWLLLARQIDIGILFQCGTQALGLAEGPTVKAAVAFLCGFIGHSRELPPLQAVVTAHGLELNHKILSCIGGESTRVLAETMADLLLVLNKKYFDNQARWLQELIVSRDDGFPSPRATPEQRVNFAKMVLKERANKRRMQEIVREFSLACRGMLGTEYGSQVSPYF